MKNSNYFIRTVAMLAGLVLTGGVVSNASAVGTASGTSISNSATVDYLVGGVNQPDVNSNTATFVVDTKIDLTVAESGSAATSVAPGATEQVLTFSVTNDGNATQDFLLSSPAVSTGVSNATNYGSGAGDDTFDATSVSIYVDSQTTGPLSGIYDPADTLSTTIDDLAADGSVSVFIVATIPIGQVTGDIASYHLLAEARAIDGSALTPTSGGDTTGIDIVFADGVGTYDLNLDAKHSSQDDYAVLTAALTVTKGSAVIWDPFNLSDGTQKRIPGAVVEYTIQIDNAAGGTTATNITVSDDLTTEEVTNGTIAFFINGYAALQGIQVTAPNLYGGAATALTNASGDDEGDYGITAANVVTVTGIDLDAGQSATVKFQVTIQ